MQKLKSTLYTVDFETEAIDGAIPPKPVGVAIRHPDGSSQYLAWAHSDNNNCTEAYATTVLKEIFSKYPVLMHNAKFDINVAKYHLGIEYPTELHDTLVLLFLKDPHAKTLALKPSAEAILNIPPTARDEVVEWILANVPGVTPKKAGAHICKAPVHLVGPYACSDVDMTFALFVKLYEQHCGKAYVREIKLLPILCASTLRGIELDLQRLLKDYLKYSTIREEVSWRIFAHLGRSFNINSGDELAAAIIKAGIPADWVLTKTGKASTSKENLLAAVKDDKLLALLNYHSVLSTYLDTFFSSWIGKENRGRINFDWNQVRNDERFGGFNGTRTGRLSSTPSMLNIPKNPPVIGVEYNLPKLPAMRQYLLPYTGDLWLSRDFSSQELRILAHYDDGVLMHAFRKQPDLDLHQMMSEILSAVLGRPISRRAAKTIAFSILYGSGMSALADGLHCDIQEAKTIKKAYLKELPGIVNIQASIEHAWSNGAPIKTWGGRYYSKEPSRFITDKKTGLERFADFTYKGLNYLIQSSAADVTKQAIINYDEIKKDGVFLLAVHDQIDISAPLSEMPLLREAMNGVELDVPLISDGSYGLNMTTSEMYNDDL